jgi:hypothetical protein
MVPMGDGYCPHPVPLRAIHILRLLDSTTSNPEAAPTFELLSGFDRVQRLLENLYRPHYLKGQGTQANLMRLAGLIAQQATLAAVTRQRNAAEADGLVGFLESAWAERFATPSTEEKN